MTAETPPLESAMLSALRRKYSAQLTDLQLLVMMLLRHRTARTLTDLSDEVRRAFNSVSAACSVLCERGLIMKKTARTHDKIGRYSLGLIELTASGDEFLTKILGHDGN